MSFRFFREEFQKFNRAFRHSSFLFLILIGNSFLLAAVTVVFLLEKGTNPNMQTFFDSLWWGVSTITTVGFGDAVPVTFWGRIIGMMLMYTGTILFIAFTGMLVTHWMREEVEREIDPLERKVEAEERETVKVEKILQEIRERLDRLERK